MDRFQDKLAEKMWLQYQDYLQAGDLSLHNTI